MEADTKHSVIKGAVAWLGVWLSHLGINSWSDAAAVVATIYSILLICEWVWKHFFRKRAHGQAD